MSSAARAFDGRVLAGLRVQLGRRREALVAGARPVGWKIGLGDPVVQRRLGIGEPVVGFLTDATLVDPGGTHSLAGAARPAAEAEVAVALRRDVEPDSETDAALAAIESLAPAIEIVDLDRPPEELEQVVAGNVFHRALVLGRARQDVAVSAIRAAVSLDGELRHEGPAELELAATICLVADLLGACDERLRAGDRIIAGALVPPVPLAPGEELAADLGPLGTLELRLAG